jgi:hypothetical protein
MRFADGEAIGWKAKTVGMVYGSRLYSDTDVANER